MEKLTEQQKQWLIDDCFNSIQIDQTLEKIGMSRREFAKYMKFDAEFAAEYKQAEIDSCLYIENTMLNLHKQKNITHKMAAVALNALSKILAYRDPSKYGNKVDLSLNQNVSIRIALESANQRVFTVLKDVTPKIESA